MFLTKTDIAKLPKSAFADSYTMRQAVSNTYACGITIETAEKIIRDFSEHRLHHPKPKE